MIIDTSILRIEAVLDAPVTTSELPISVSFSEGTRIQTAEIVFLSRTVTDGTTDVVILSPPSNKEKRLVKNLTVCNIDTVNAILTLKYDDDVTPETCIIRVTLQPGDTLQFTEEEGFRIIDFTGGVKTSGLGPFGVPLASVDIGDSALEGGSINHSRADHQHFFPAPTPGYPIDVDAGAESDGVATTPSRSDHKHTVDAAVPTGDINIGDTALEGVDDPLARSDHQHAQPAPPASYPTQVDIEDTQVDGVATTPARSDHQHAFPAPGAGYPLDVVALESDGVSVRPARSDHVHKFGILTTAGDLLVHNATLPVRFPVGTNGQVITADSAQAEGIRWTDLDNLGGLTATINLEGTDTVVTGTTTETTIYSFTIPANTLSTDHRLRLE